MSIFQHCRAHPEVGIINNNGSQLDNWEAATLPPQWNNIDGKEPLHGLVST
jgi:hypothetical protein